MTPSETIKRMTNQGAWPEQVLQYIKSEADKVSDNAEAFALYKSLFAEYEALYKGHALRFRRSTGKRRPTMSKPEITITRIGVISHGIDGSDEYVLLTRLDDDLDVDTAYEWLHPQVYRRGSGPGSYFCDRITVIPKPYHSGEVIAIIHHRYDV